MCPKPGPDCTVPCKMDPDRGTKSCCISNRSRLRHKGTARMLTAPALDPSMQQQFWLQSQACSSGFRPYHVLHDGCGAAIASCLPCPSSSWISSTGHVARASSLIGRVIDVGSFSVLRMMSIKLDGPSGHWGARFWIHTLFGSGRMLLCGEVGFTDPRLVSFSFLHCCHSALVSRRWALKWCAPWCVPWPRCER